MLHVELAAALHNFYIPFVRAHELWPVILSVISAILEFIGFALCIQGPNDNCCL